MAEGTLVVNAPAKINLYLGVHAERDERGYHRVDSLMAAVDLADTVTVEPADELTVETVPATYAPMEKNTAYRAAMAMGEHYGREPHFKIAIDKRIPFCAGLGGPSTDAAAVILALANIWGIDAVDPALDKIARSIGADVPFFLHQSPSFYEGGGDVFIEGYDALAGTPVVLIKPREARVSTPEAYRAFDEQAPAAQDPAPMRAALAQGNGNKAISLIHNNLAIVSAQLEPRIAEVLTWMRAQEGALAADVCGSGACSFCVCASTEDAERIAWEARANGDWWVCETSLVSKTCTVRPS